MGVWEGKLQPKKNQIIYQKCYWLSDFSLDGIGRLGFAYYIYVLMYV